MSSYRLVNTNEFIRVRYERFLESKKRIEALPAKARACVHYTDLDKKYYGDEKSMKYNVVCDHCNEYIEDAVIIMYESCRVYHRKCIASELPKDFEDKLDNVVFVDFTNDDGSDGRC